MANSGDASTCQVCRHPRVAPARERHDSVVNNVIQMSSAALKEAIRASFDAGEKTTPREVFARLDSDNDGMCDAAEFQVFCVECERICRGPDEQGRYAVQSDALFKELDLDGDGKISFQEVEAWLT